MSTLTQIDARPNLNLPWDWRSQKYDDWGTIRDALGDPVLDGCRLAQYTDIEATEARMTKTVPPRVEAICRFTIRAVNAHDDLVAALKALREIVKDHPDFQKRDFIDLGIQVNNALTRAES